MEVSGPTKCEPSTFLCKSQMVYVMPTVVAAALAAAAIREGMFSTRIDEADDETPDSEDG